MSFTTSFTSEFFRQLEESTHNGKETSGPKVHVSEITSLVSFVYEKIRNIVDYKDEYLVRKNAIRRFFKRTLLLPKFSQDPQAGALALVRELILSRYLPNDNVPESVIPDLANILIKYSTLLKEATHHGCDVPRWREMVLGLAAVETDSYLISPAERHAYTTYAYRLLKPAIELVDSTESEEVKNVQLVLSIQRVMERADRDIMMYYLLRHYHHDWFTLPPEQAARTLAPELTAYLTTFGQIIENRLGRRLQSRVRRLLVPLIILRDLLRNFKGTSSELVTRSTKLEHVARETYINYWKAIRKRIRRKGFHAMAYIFLTKMLLAILIEVPYERFVLGGINYLPVGINLMFPPFLMLIITLLIKSPGYNNRETVVRAVGEMVYGTEPDFFKPRRLKTEPPVLWKRVTYGLLYVITMGASFGLLYVVLKSLGFNLLSGALFLFFVSLVSFFGLSLREQARQVKVLSGKETMVGFIVDFFTLPIVAFGKWLSNTFDKVNVFVFILDFLFEMPFKTLLKVIEDWFNFLKEKKEDLY